MGRIDQILLPPVWMFDEANVVTYGKYIKISFVTIYTLCHEICFVIIYALLCEEKLSQHFS